MKEYFIFSDDSDTEITSNKCFPNIIDRQSENVNTVSKKMIYYVSIQYIV